jgi:hypothetical protein
MEEVYALLLFILLFLVMYAHLVYLLGIPMDDDMFHEL